MPYFSAYARPEPVSSILQTFGIEPSIDPTARIYDSTIGTWTEIGPQLPDR